MKSSIFDTWSKMMSAASTNMQWMQNSQKMAEQNIQAMQMMVDAMNMVTRRARQESQDMMESYMETCRSNASSYQAPDNITDLTQIAENMRQMQNAATQSLTSMNRWYSNWASRNTENWVEMSQVMNKSGSEAQRILATSCQNMIQSFEKQYQNTLKSMTSMYSASNQPAGDWSAWTGETADWFSKNASNWMQTSSNWWSDMNRQTTASSSRNNTGNSSQSASQSNSSAGSNSNAGKTTASTTVKARKKPTTASASK